MNDRIHMPKSLPRLGAQVGVALVLLALCFLFIELAAFRILLRIFMGPHKKLYHPVAYRSS